MHAHNHFGVLKSSSERSTVSKCLQLPHNAIVGATVSHMSVVATNRVITGIYFRTLQLHEKACFRKACILRPPQVKNSKPVNVDKILLLSFKGKFTLHYAFEPSLAQLCVLRLLKN